MERRCPDGQTIEVSGRLRVIDSTGHRHQVDHDFVGHSNDRISGNIAVGDLVDGMILEHVGCLLDPRHVLGSRIDKQVTWSFALRRER